MIRPIAQTKFKDRREAGRLLATKLSAFANRSDVIVLALPRGGVPVAYEIAKSLKAPLEVFVVRKLGVPYQPELAMGAIASGGIRVLNEDLLRYLEISPVEIEAVAAREQRELERRERLYRGGRSMREVRDRIVILVDDGIATGATMRSAVSALKQQQPARIIIAVPAAAQSSCDEYQTDADRIECVCLISPEPFFAVGLWYENFSQTSDDEVRDLLVSFSSNQSPGASNGE
ncbi:MAG: phosphoribosyltransferase [Gammaproteobacteria bacterium]